MLPTLRQLHYLRLLAQNGSFSRAAEAAHVTQPTLSAGIQELEKTLGVALVDRARSGLILAAAGAETLRRGDTILALAEDLVQAAQGAAEPLSGRFRLGVIPTVAPFLLPRTLPGIRTAYPKLRLFLKEDQTQRLIAALRSGHLDAALIAMPYDMTGLDWLHIETDELLAAAPSAHPLARNARIDPLLLAAEDLILLEDGHCLRNHALAACGLQPPKANDGEGFEATSLATLVQMVGSGLGFSFVPAMAVDAGLTANTDVTIRPLLADKPSRDIVMAWRDGSSREIEARMLGEKLRTAA